MLEKDNATRDNSTTQPQPPEQPVTLKLNISGIQKSAYELYGACLLNVEVANLIENIPDAPHLLGKEIFIRLMTARLCTQQALDHARVNS